MTGGRTRPSPMRRARQPARCSLRLLGAAVLATALGPPVPPEVAAPRPSGVAAARPGQGANDGTEPEPWLCVPAWDVALRPPPGFRLDASGPGAVVWRTPPDGPDPGATLRLVVRPDLRPLTDALRAHAEERRGGADGAPWSWQPWPRGGTLPAPFTEARLAESRDGDGRLLLAGLRNGTALVLVSLQAPAAGQALREPGLLRTLAGLRLRPREPVFLDRRLGLALYALPPGWRGAGSRTIPGRFAQWTDGAAPPGGPRRTLVGEPVGGTVQAWSAEAREQAERDRGATVLSERSITLAGHPARRLELRLAPRGERPALRQVEIRVADPCRRLVLRARADEEDWPGFAPELERVLASVEWLDPP